MAEEEHNDDGEEHGGHGGVPAVALGDAVVYQGGSERKTQRSFYILTNI